MTELSVPRCGRTAKVGSALMDLLESRQVYYTLVDSLYGRYTGPERLVALAPRLQPWPSPGDIGENLLTAVLVDLPVQ